MANDMELSLRDLISVIIWDNAEIKIEYGKDPSVDNADHLADLIITAIKEYEVGRRPY